MQNKTKMLRKLIFAVIFTVALTVILSGCGKQEISIDGMYVATFEFEGGTMQTPTRSRMVTVSASVLPGWITKPVNAAGKRVAISLAKSAKPKW